MTSKVNLSKINQYFQLEFFEGEYTQDNLSSMLMKAGLNGVFQTNFEVKEIFKEMKLYLMGNQASKIKCIDLLK